MRYIKLLIMLILLSIAAVGNCQNLQKAGALEIKKRVKIDRSKAADAEKEYKNTDEVSALVVLEDLNQNVILSARNIKGVKTVQVGELNVYDVLKYGTVVASQAAVEKITEVYA